MLGVDPIICYSFYLFETNKDTLVKPEYDGNWVFGSRVFQTACIF